jgi:hypothetical protein
VRSRIHFSLVGHRGIAALFTALDPNMRVTRVTADTKLVIDGFPRSGNSYSAAAFRHANGEHVQVASHRHSPTSVLAGLRRGIPVIVLIRRPRPAIASALQYEPDQPTEWGIELYRRFYEGILPMADQVLIATFVEVASDFGQVIRRCNVRFNSAFVPYERTEESEQAVAEIIDQAALTQFRQSDLPRVSGRPSSSRMTADEFLRRQDRELSAQFDELDKLYDAVLLHK